VTLRLTLLIAIALAVLPQRVASQSQAAALRAYLATAATLSDADFVILDRGRPVNKVVPAKNAAEIYLLGVIHVSTTPATYIQRVTDPSRLMSLPGYRGIGVIGEASTAEELGGFTLEPDDVEDLRDCRMADCAVQLPAGQMPAARAAARHAIPATAAHLLNTQFREMALDMVRQYRTRGNAALPVYYDESRPASVNDHFRALMLRVEGLSLLPPALARVMLDYPNAEMPATARSLFYWERVVFGLKPTLRVTHAVAYEPDAVTGLACAVAIKQVYASHYLRAALDFSACVPAPERDGRPGFYLVALKASQQEGVIGFTGSLIRRIVVSRARTALDGSLTRIKNALEGK
jgi:hypothetical protein